MLSSLSQPLGEPPVGARLQHCGGPRAQAGSFSDASSSEAPCKKGSGQPCTHRDTGRFWGAAKVGDAVTTWRCRCCSTTRKQSITETVNHGNSQSRKQSTTVGYLSVRRSVRLGRGAECSVPWRVHGLAGPPHARCGVAWARRGTRVSSRAWRDVYHLVSWLH